MTIRRAEEKDIGKIKDLLVQVNNVHHRARPDLFIENRRKYNDSELLELIANDKKPIFVAEDNNEVIGYAFCALTAHKNDNNLTDIKTLYIDDLCVDEKVRGKHVGTAIFDYVKSYAKTVGCYNITLNVWSGNESAAKFYTKCGLLPQKTTLETIL